MAFLTLEKIENYLDGFEIALSQIDRIRVEEIINQAKELYQPIQIATVLITPTLQKIGEKWEDGSVGLAQIYMAAKIDLILMDIQLPKMDGYEATKRIREIEELKEVLIIAITSYAMVGDKEKILAAGCNAYIEKPINPESFIEELKKYL